VAYGLWVWVFDSLRLHVQVDATALVVGALALGLLPAVLGPLRAAGSPRPRVDMAGRPA
jgi:hypothetical protein